MITVLPLVTMELNGERLCLSFSTYISYIIAEITRDELQLINSYVLGYIDLTSLTARFMGPTSGPSWADRTHVGPMLAPWTLLSGCNTECMYRRSHFIPSDSEAYRSRSERTLNYILLVDTIELVWVSFGKRSCHLRSWSAGFIFDLKRLYYLLHLLNWTNVRRLNLTKCIFISGIFIMISVTGLLITYYYWKLNRDSAKLVHLKWPSAAFIKTASKNTDALIHDKLRM